MTTPPDLGLRTSLHRVADAVEPLPVADDLWRRGQAARRRAQALVVAAVLFVLASLGGVVTLVSSDREVRTASTPVVPGGAIPSRITDPGDLTLEEDLALGRASVAFLSETGRPVVVGATDGRYHALALDDAPEDDGLLALSPDGRHLAWSNHGRIRALHLENGTATFFPRNDEHVSVATLAWAPGSHQLLWTGTDRAGGRHGGVLPAGDAFGGPLFPSALRGIPSPSGDLVALSATETGPAALFFRRAGKALDRTLPADLYPDGATVRPLGWTERHLVLADVDAPPGSYVEGRHLTLFTSPDRPDSEWTYRIVMRDVPDVASLSLAVDLVPDLDGTSSQVLTHDFDADARSADQRDISWLIGLGVAAAIGVLLGLRWLWRQARRSR